MPLDSLLTVVAGTSDEVDHDTLLTLMVSMFSLAIGSPLVVMLIQTRRARQDRQEDRIYREATARRLEVSNQRVAAKADEVAERTDRSLALIHELGNSNLTKTMENERDAIEQALGAITEAINLKLSLRQEVLPETLAAQARLDEQLDALTTAISERHRKMAQLLNGSRRVAPPDDQDQLK